MKAKRSAILGSLLVSLTATLWLGGVTLWDSEQPDVVVAGHEGNGQSDVGAPAQLASDPEAQFSAEPSTGGIGSWLTGIGALLASCVLFVSTILFRVEVRQEKAALRARQNRLDYHRDLRRYKNQLKGPPRDNT